MGPAQPQHTINYKLWGHWRIMMIMDHKSDVFLKGSYNAWLSFVSRIKCLQRIEPGGCSISKSCLTPYDRVDCSTPVFPVLHHLPEFAQTHVHWVSDAVQPSHPLSSPYLFAFNLFQHRVFFQWASSSPQVAKVLDLQFQSFQWIFRVDFP